MYIIYRISNNSYNKQRLEWATKEYCLRNALEVFTPSEEIKWIILGDNLNDEARRMITRVILELNAGMCNPDVDIIKFKEINACSNGKSFNIQLDEALKLPDEEIVYLLEDDYIHLPNSINIVLDVMMNTECEYLTLYNHPDKFIPSVEGGNPEVEEDGSYLTKIYQGRKSFYYFVNSTTMTFVTRVGELRNDENIFRKYTNGNICRDYEMWLELRELGNVLLCPIPGYSTHTETKWLSPLIDWEKK